MAFKATKFDVNEIVKKASISTLREILPPPNTDDDGTVKYVGYAPAGVSTDENGWQIFRHTTSGDVVVVEMPDSSMEFAFNWDDRASYNYSR